MPLSSGASGRHFQTLRVGRGIGNLQTMPQVEQSALHGCFVVAFGRLAPPVAGRKRLRPRVVTTPTETPPPTPLATPLPTPRPAPLPLPTPTSPASVEATPPRIPPGTPAATPPAPPPWTRPSTSTSMWLSPLAVAAPPLRISSM